MMDSMEMNVSHSKVRKTTSTDENRVWTFTFCWISVSANLVGDTV